MTCRRPSSSCQAKEGRSFPVLLSAQDSGTNDFRPPEPHESDNVISLPTTASPVCDWSAPRRRTFPLADRRGPSASIYRDEESLLCPRSSP
jgi:hypothetical protein